MPASEAAAPPNRTRARRYCLVLRDHRRCPLKELSLSGEWEFRFEGDPAWQPVSVPGCWEMLDVPKDRSGPAWYRTRFVAPVEGQVVEKVSSQQVVSLQHRDQTPEVSHQRVMPGRDRDLTLQEEFEGRRLWLRFGAVSYDCTITVNGREVGGHLGLWDPFTVEVTGAVRQGERAELLVRVEKPASPTSGHGSTPVAGRFPLRETLSGFLPYVWGHVFGGIWQDVTLISTGQVAFGNVYVCGTAGGRVTVEAEISAPGTVSLVIASPNGEVVYEEESSGVGSVAFDVTVPDPRPWSPRHPDLYEARLHLAGGDERTVRFGLRSLRAEGANLLLNERPVYPRMALSWGWYPESLHSNPGPDRVRADLERLRDLGYNGVKLCLWFPPEYYFDLADELGMLLWVELPMWRPEPTEFFIRQTPLEYDRLVRLARNHPSVVLYTLGCELGGNVGADVLQPLYERVKALAGEALVRDNSGSGEAYGGLLTEFADYYDYHFYCDLQHFRPLLDYFSPRWRPELPWLFGEYCDLDTFRDLRRIYSSGGGVKPWWTVADPDRNPRGARWQYDVVEQEARLRENGYWERGEELERISEQQGLLHRKYTLETTRAYREVSGYVVTGERDTPISTAGMLDDLGRVKYDPARFRQFNDDLVALAGWDRRRAWVGGGDRATYWDTWSYTAGDLVRPHLIASHYGTARDHARVEWTVSCPGELLFATGETMTPFEVMPGSVRELCVAELAAPEVDAPCTATLHVSIWVGDESAENSWPLWVFPRDAWAGVEGVARVDPAGRLAGLAKIAPGVQDTLQDASVAIATTWTPEVEAFVAGGGGAVILQAGQGPPGPVPTVELPFWREAVRIVEPHPAWRDFPHGGCAGLQFFGCATDHALDTASVSGQVMPILRRLDARTMHVHDYAAEMVWGDGRLIVSTLRFEGGLGEQPVGISRNTAAAYLLSCWVRRLLGR